jgi:phospholipid/cholesterol/gamma-HCH transport system substrate-binding protein
MNSRAIEVLVGVFMILFLGAMFILAMKVSNLTSFTSSAGYTLVAKFENVGGLKARASVAASGVKVGEVTQITYDPETFEAAVSLSIDEKFIDTFPTDTTASIYTAGLLGEQYIGLDPGAEMDMLKNSDEITLTQSAIVLERLIGQVLFSRSGGS